MCTYVCMYMHIYVFMYYAYIMSVFCICIKYVHTYLFTVCVVRYVCTLCVFMDKFSSFPGETSGRQAVPLSGLEQALCAAVTFNPDQPVGGCPLIN